MARFTGQGSAATSRFRLPRARYTVFVRYDPPEAVKAFAIADGRGRRWPDWRHLPAPGDVMAPLVQEMLAAGTYQAQVETETPTCGWDIQVVLNSMQSWRLAPPSWKASAPPPQAITVRSEDMHRVVVERTGEYTVGWSLGSTDAHGMHTYTYSLHLRAASDGHLVEIAVASEGRARRVGMVFLTAGEWIVEMTAEVEWELSLSPVVGSTGGGARGF